MPLTPTARTFLTTTLGVNPKTRGLALFSKDVALRQSFDDYARREGKVILAIQALEALLPEPGLETLTAALSLEVTQIQGRVTAATRDDGTTVFKTAYDELDALKDRAKALLPKVQAYQAAKLLAENAITALDDAPVVKDDIKAMRKRLMTPAATQLGTDAVDAAVALLNQVPGACTGLRGLANAWDAKLLEAENLLKAHKSKIPKADYKMIEKTIIAAAKKKADRGHREDALALLADVDEACKLGLDNTKYERRCKPLEKLIAHKQTAEFADEIAALQRKQLAAKAVSEAGLRTENSDKRSLVDMAQLPIYWEANQYLEQADKHQLYADERDAIAGDYRKVKDAEPKTSDAAIAEQVQKIDALLAKAVRQSDKRQYETAMATLALAKTAVAEAGAVKTAHGKYAAELLRVGELVKTLPDVPDTPSAAEAASLRQRVADARSGAESGKDYGAALALLQRVGADCDLCLEHQKSTEKDGKAHQDALAGLADDPAVSLEAVRKLLADLEKRSGHRGVRPQIKAIKALIQQAETALKD